MLVIYLSQFQIVSLHQLSHISHKDKIRSDTKGKMRTDIPKMLIKIPINHLKVHLNF